MRFFRDLKKHFPYIVSYTKAELKSEVSGSYLNWIWWILNPLCMMLVYTFIFGVAFDGREANFPIFIFIGLTLWNFFDHTVMSSVKIVKRNKATINRVYLPKYVLVLSDMGVNGFKMLVSFAVIFVMMVIYRIRVNVSLLYLIPILITLFLVTYGVSCICLHLGVYVQDLNDAMKILLRIVYFMTGIFYDVQKRIPAPYGKWVMRLNPLAVTVDAARGALLNAKVTNVGLLAIWFGISVLLSALGTALIYKNENSYAKVI